MALDDGAPRARHRRHVERAPEVEDDLLHVQARARGGEALDEQPLLEGRELEDPLDVVLDGGHAPRLPRSATARAPSRDPGRTRRAHRRGGARAASACSSGLDTPLASARAVASVWIAAL